jgi:hypothetical protein
MERSDMFPPWGDAPPPWGYPPHYVVDEAASAGMLETVEWLVARPGFGWHPVEHLDDRRMRHRAVFVWVVEGRRYDANKISDEALMRMAARHGDVECMRWVCEERGVVPDRETMLESVSSRQVDALAWVCEEKGVAPDGKCWKRLSRLRMNDDFEGVASVARWLLARDVAIPEAHLVDVGRLIVGTDDASLVERFVPMMLRVRPSCLTVMAERALSKGCVKVAELLIDEVKALGPRSLKQSLRNAVVEGHVAILEWCHSVGVSVSQCRPSRYGVYGSVAMALWWDQNFGPLGEEGGGVTMTTVPRTAPPG